MSSGVNKQPLKPAVQPHAASKAVAVKSPAGRSKASVPAPSKAVSKTTVPQQVALQSEANIAVSVNSLSKANVEAGHRFDAVEQEFHKLLSDHVKLKELWTRLDFNGNGIVSLAELDKLMVEAYPVLNHKPALMRAFQKTTLRDGDGLTSFSLFNLSLFKAIHSWRNMNFLRCCGTCFISTRFNLCLIKIAAVDFFLLFSTSGGHFIFINFDW